MLNDWGRAEARPSVFLIVIRGIRVIRGSNRGSRPGLVGGYTTNNGKATPTNDPN